MEGFGFHDSNRGFLQEPSAYANKECRTLQQWISCPAGAWVLCGAPGTGKTGAIHRWLELVKKAEPDTAIIAWTTGMFGAAANFECLSRQPTFIEALTSQRNLILVIDGFDQFRTEGGLPFESLTAFLTSIPDRSRLRLVIGCRSRDWNSTHGQALITLWGKPENPRVLEICQLRRSEVVLATEAFGGISSQSFLNEVFAKRLEAAAQWPLPLGSLMNQFSNEGGLTASVREMFSRTIDQLLADARARLPETNALHRRQLRQCASRLAALTNFGGYSRIGRSETSLNSLKPSEFCGSYALASEVTTETGEFVLSEPMLHQLLGTALFTTVEPPLVQEPDPPFGFTHQNYAEFLAAEYVAHLNIDQLRSLLAIRGLGGETVPGPLVETTSWLAVMRPDWFAYLVSSMPEILVRADGAQYSNEQKLRLVQALLERAHSWNASVFEDLKLLTPAFNFSGLAEILEPVIVDACATNFPRRLAMEIAERCKLSALEEALWQVLERDNEDENLRYWATRALLRILMEASLGEKSIQRLNRAMRGEMGPDANDELKGAALRCLVPRVLKPREVAQFLTICQNGSYYGNYSAFLNRVLPAILTEDDLEAFLGLGAITPSLFHVQFTSNILATAVLKLFSKVTSPTQGMKQGFIGWVQRCVKNHTMLPLSERHSFDSELAESLSDDIPITKRFEWLTMFVKEKMPSKDSDWAVIHALGFPHPPLDLTLNALNEAEPALRPFWAEIVRFSLGPDQRIAHLDALLAAYERHEELRTALLPCKKGKNIHQTYNEIAHKAAKENERHLRQRKKSEKELLSRRQLLDVYIGQWKTDGTELSWINLWQICGLDEAGVSFDWSGEMLTDWKGWKSLTVDEQSHVRGCAKAFLMLRDDPHRNASEWKATKWTDAARYAVGLLSDELGVDHQLAQTVGQKWVIAWSHHHCDNTGANRKIASVFYKLHPETVIRLMRSNFQKENEANNHCQSVRLLADCWGNALSAELTDWLSADNIQPTTFRTGVQFLSSKAPDSAISLLSGRLDRMASEGKETEDPLREVIILCSLLFSNGELFEQAITLLSDATNARRILCLAHGDVGDGAHGLPSTLTALTNEQLGRLTVLVAHAFPEDERAHNAAGDEIDEPGEQEIDDEEAAGLALEKKSGQTGRTTTSSMLMHRISTSIIAHFASVATSKEIDALRPQMPAGRRTELAFRRSSAQRQAAQIAWEPLTPVQLLKLVQMPHACFVRTNDDLLEFILLRLQAFADQPWDISVQPLWNEDDGKPTTAKNEEALSNTLKRWLDKDWQLVVNREVQPIETMPNRLDLKIDIPGQPALCVIIEVKKAGNAEVLTSLQTQLIDRYLIAGRQTHGVYLVAYFGDKGSPFRGKSIEEVRQELQHIRDSATLPPDVRVSTLLMDFRHLKVVQRALRKPKRKQR